MDHCLTVDTLAVTVDTLAVTVHNNYLAIESPFTRKKVIHFLRKAFHVIAHFFEGGI
jgi:hypothetical protein